MGIAALPLQPFFRAPGVEGGGSGADAPCSVHLTFSSSNLSGWAIANLDNISENTQSAESRIRDTDMAEEMVNYSKNNILAQAGQSMLAQANQSTQGVLSLLQ